jgi:ABC-2 type transport system permease protein
MNVFIREMRDHMKGLMIWSGIILVFMLMVFVEFEAYYENPEMAEILDVMPRGMLEAFGMYGANLTTINGYMSIVALYLYIMLGIFAVLLGNNIIGKEERDKTGEFLLSMPIKRYRVLISKVLAAVLNCFLLMVVAGIGIAIAINPYRPQQENFEYIIRILGASFMIQMIFLSLGLFIAASSKVYKKSSAIAVALVIVTYIISVIQSLSKSVEFLKYFTPFKYFQASDILQHNGFEGIYLALTGIIVLLALLGVFYIYPRRDLKL